MREDRRQFHIQFIIVVVFGALGVSFILWYCFDSPFKPGEVWEQYSKAQLLLTAFATAIVYISLYYIVTQFRKVIAMPSLKLAFDEEGRTTKSINLSENELEEVKVPIYVRNNGEKVSTLYQIELQLPSLFQRYLVRAVEGDRLDGKPSSVSDAFTISFYSYGKPEYTCFVDKPVPIGIIRLRKSDTAAAISKDLKIVYKIFGDWGKHQEGTLTLKLRKIDQPSE